MSENRLYIIGNGFDIFHGVKSKYSDFESYVLENDYELYKALEEYFNTEELWSDFEETLAYIDTDKIVEDAMNFLESYGSDDWSESCNHDYQYEVQMAIDLVTIKLKEYFTKWVLNLNIPNSVKLNLPVSSYYFSFNYTDTLEKNYKISPSNIVHIHSKAIDESSTLILGHSRKPTANNAFTQKKDWEDLDFRIIEGNRILDRYFNETYKNTDTIINENKIYFRQLDSIEEVYVLGHSISSVDIKYFQVICNSVQENCIWTVSYFCDNQKEIFKETLKSIGVPEEKIKLIKLAEILACKL